MAVFRGNALKSLNVNWLSQGPVPDGQTRDRCRLLRVRIRLLCSDDGLFRGPHTMNSSVFSARWCRLPAGIALLTPRDDVATYWLSLHFETPLGLTLTEASPPSWTWSARRCDLTNATGLALIRLVFLLVRVFPGS